MKRLTEKAQTDRDDFERYADKWGSCTCFGSPSCHVCLHPGNPLNQEEEEFWEEVDSLPMPVANIFFVPYRYDKTSSTDAKETRLRNLLSPAILPGHCPCGIDRSRCDYHK